MGRREMRNVLAFFTLFWVAAALGADKPLDLGEHFDIDGVESEGEMVTGFDQEGHSFAAEGFLKAGRAQLPVP